MKGFFGMAFAMVIGGPLLQIQRRKKEMRGGGGMTSPGSISRMLCSDPVMAAAESDQPKLEPEIIRNIDGAAILSQPILSQI